MEQTFTSSEQAPFDRSTPLVPPWHDEIPARLDPFSRDDCAILIDFYLRRLVALKNRIDPGLSAGLARMRDAEKHRLLGFVRMQDYTAEALDLDWRRARYLLTIHDVFQELPLLAEAFENGRLSWTRAREITSVADSESQGQWLQFANATTVRLLAEAVRQFKSTGQLPWEDGRQTGSDKAGQRDEETGIKAALSTETTDEADQQWTTFSSPVPFALRQRWEAAVEACRRHAGAETPLWECAEYMAAEILDTVSGFACEEEVLDGGPVKSGSGGPAGSIHGIPGSGGQPGGSSADQGQHPVTTSDADRDLIRPASRKKQAGGRSSPGRRWW